MACVRQTSCHAYFCAPLATYACDVGMAQGVQTLGSSRSARPHPRSEPVFALISPRLIRVWFSCAQVTNSAEVQKLSDGGMLPVILHFWAGWAPMCAQTKEIASRLAGECPNVRFANVEAEEAEVCYNTAAHGALSVCTTLL